MVKKKAYDQQTKRRVIEHYRSGSTLEQTAGKFQIHRNTLWRWVKKYKQSGTESLKHDILSCRHWKRLPQETEDRIIALKESMPGCTVRHAQTLLYDQGTEVSLKGIWSVWQRYGLTGFAREEISHTYQEYCQRVVPPGMLDRIRSLIRANEFRRAADMANSLPIFPYRDVILQIPSGLLSLRRQIDRIRAEFGKIPLARYRQKANILRRKLEYNGLLYSSLWVSIAECYALMWSGRPREVLRLVSIGKKRTKGIRDARLRFILLLLEGQANAGLLRIKRANACVIRCKIIARTSRNPHFLMGGIGGIYSTMGYYREALQWTEKALQGAALSYRQQLYANIAQFHGTAGDYRAAFPALKKGKLEEWGFLARVNLIRAYVYLDQGNFQKARAYAVETLLQVKKEGVRSLIHPATLILASCHSAAGEVKKANTMLKEIMPLLSKYNLKQEYWQRKIILENAPVPDKVLQVPGLRLTYLLRGAQRSMRIRDYRNAYEYGHAKKILGIFMRLIPFFPELVVHLLKKGRNPFLPKTFLDMPVFQINTPVFNVFFLGKFQVLKQGKLMRRMRLSSKETSFLIHLSLNKNRRIALKDLYENFWPRSKHPARNLSHLLTRLRRSLTIPSHLIRIKTETLYWDMYFFTDFEQFKEHLAKARFFAQAGEKDYAIREYKCAFHLYRGAPFQGMYDNWSENMRRVILNLYETSKSQFTRNFI